MEIFETWDALRAAALSRDANRCTVSRLLGGNCSVRLDVHHLHPVSDGGPALPGLDGVITACSRHHPMVEAIRREVLRRRPDAQLRCPHRHRSAEARRICERRLARAA